jgi:hypothetical protein
MGLQQVPAIPPVISVGGTAGRTTSSGGITPTIDLATSGVSAATYGSSTTIPQLAVDQYGRITSISNAGLTASSAMTLVGSQTASSGSITFSNIPAHKSLIAHVIGTASSNTPMGVQMNGLTNNTYINNLIGYQGTTPFVLRQNPAGGSLGSQPDTSWRVGRFFVNGAEFNAMITFPNSGSTRTRKAFFASVNYDGNEGQVTPTYSNGIYTMASGAATTSLKFFSIDNMGGTTTIDLYAMS